ncbi:terminase large subunit domain-containing protein [Klebsiella aerogenes]|uniref:terminase large subunit domain-containing protein n=1 Tax=Klebsiella aerogenes TaxID=548 RepID=UPI002D7F29FC|nr:terminase family protein [Klebsiella aerogenes]
MDLLYQQREQYESFLEALQGINLNDMPENTLIDIKRTVDDYTAFKAHNKLLYYKPLPYQLKWIEASNHYKQRYLSASNRSGKTYNACMELAAHITGLYPRWWNGMRLEKTGTYWAMGVSHESTCKVLQKELLGVEDIRHKHLIGTGSIPRERIIIESIVPDGQRCLSVQVEHITGEINTLHFYASTQNQMAWMGQNVLYALLDEQFNNEDEVYAQCLTRTANVEGYISVVATPEQGESPLWTRFHDDESGYLYFQNATWDDLPEHVLSSEQKLQLLAGFPKWQHKMRSMGIPVNGSGAVFPFDESELIATCTWDMVKPTWNIMAGVDFGYSGVRDDSTIVFCAHDKETDIVYTIDAWTSSDDREKDHLSHMPEYMAKIIKACPYPNIPVITPHDGNGIITGTTKTRAQVLRESGCNVLYDNYYIPYQLSGDVKKSNSLIGGLDHMVKWMANGLFKISPASVSSGMNMLWKEFRNYVWDSKKEGNKIRPVDKNNHCLDALRYASTTVKYLGSMACECGDGNYVDELRNHQDMQHALAMDAYRY